MPACTRGCSVLTRPSRHSGKPVSSSTWVTGTPAAAMRLGGRAGRDDRDAGGVQAARRAPRARSCRRPRRGRAGWGGVSVMTVSFGLVADADGPVVDVEVVARQAADPLDQHGALAGLDALVQRLASSSSSSTGTATCATIGPVSTPSSTTNSVAPVTLTPYARASRGPCMPGNDGDSAGWVLTRAAAEPGQERRAGELHEAGQHDEVGLVRRDRLGQRDVPGGAVGVRRDAAARRSGCRRARRGPGPRCRRGRRRPRRSGRRRQGRSTRRSAPAGWCREPETRTTSRAGLEDEARSRAPR